MIEFSADFPGGNAADFVCLGDDHYSFEVELHGGERGLWFYFRIDGADGPLTFDIRNASRLLGWPWLDSVRPVYGRPGAWRRLDAPAEVLGDAGALCFTVPCRGETYVAFCYPYTLDDLRRFKELPEDARLREIEVARSAGDHPVYVWELGSGPAGVWITCRNHAGETPASYVVEGFVLEMLKPENALLLDGLTARICPMVDVDNVERGSYGKYGPPCDPYMDWGPAPALEAVRALQEYFAAALEKPAVYMDLHSPEPCGSTFACTWTEDDASPEYLEAVSRVCRDIRAESRDPLKLDLSRTAGYPGWFPEGISRSAQGYFRDTYGCPAMTLEISYHWSSGGAFPDEDDYRDFGAALCRAIPGSCRI